MDATMEATTENHSDPESPCLEKFQREALLCLNTFPDKVTRLNTLIDEYTPEAVKKNQENVRPETPPSSTSINSNARDFHEATSSYSERTRDRSIKSRNGVCKRKYRLGYGGPSLRRRSRPLAQILRILVRRFSLCTQAMFVRPSKYIVQTIAAMLLHREQFRHVRCGTSMVWNALSPREDCGVVSNLIGTMRPAAVRLIADTTTLKRWLQALALVSSTPNSSLSQAIRTTETIDGWAYELFFHLKYLQVINFPYDVPRENFTNTIDNEPVDRTNFTESILELNLNDREVMHTNLWHRVVQLRDHYVILYETLRSSDKFLESNDAPI